MALLFKEIKAFPLPYKITSLQLNPSLSPPLPPSCCPQALILACSLLRLSASLQVHLSCFKGSQSPPGLYTLYKPFPDPEVTRLSWKHKV